MIEQPSMFEFTMPTFKINKPVRLIEMFAGIGSQAKALKNLGIPFEHHKAIEFDPYVMKSYNAIHGTNFEVTDIRDVKGSDLEIINKDKYCYICTYSFPCFVGNTLVLTKDGYKEIKDITVQDQVLTHNNSYKKILCSKQTGIKEIFKLKGLGFDEILCTENHRFYAREMKRYYPTYENGKRGSIRTFKEPQWIEANKLTKKHYLGIAINQNEIIPDWEGIDYEWTDGRKTRHKNQLSKLMENEKFWWLIGRYIGDGWIKSQGGIIICCNKNKKHEIQNVADEIGLHYSIAEERTTFKFHFSLKELEKFVLPFGKGAINKHLPSFMFDLPIKQAKGFIEGYMSADGYIAEDGKHKASSISKALIYGIGQLVAKVYKQPYKIYKSKRKTTHVIEGRTVNQHDIYEIVWKTETCKQDKAFYENGYIWIPFYSLESTNEYKEVYDIEVEQDHNFTANGVIAHNCQDLSLAGNLNGMKKGSGTRSGLLWEVERILDECKEIGNMPDILLMENVPNVIGKNNIKDFHLWRNKLEQLGYSNYVQLLNAKDYGIPQNRNRCFMVSILGEYNYSFPKKQKLKLRLKDLLEDKVDEKYYLSDQQIEAFKASNFNTRKNKVQNSGGGMQYSCSTRLERAKMRGSGNKKINRGGCCIPIKTANSTGYINAYEGDAIDISSRMQWHRGTVQPQRSLTLDTQCGSAIGVIVKDESE